MSILPCLVFFCQLQVVASSGAGCAPGFLPVFEASAPLTFTGCLGCPSRVEYSDIEPEKKRRYCGMLAAIRTAPLRDLGARLQVAYVCTASAQVHARASLRLRSLSGNTANARPPSRVATLKCVRLHGSHGDHARMPIGASPEERRSSNLVVGVGLLADTAMTVAKAAIGAWSGSPALLSDAVHGASDMLVSIAVLATR